jgi:hypothetical protein
METETNTENERELKIEVVPKLTAEEKLTLRKENRKAYMRLYKQRKYKENDKIKISNKAYYYKYRYNLSNDDLVKYKAQLPIVAKVRKLLKELSLESDEAFVKEVLKDYV